MKLKIRYWKILAWACVVYPLAEAGWSFFTKGEGNNLFRLMVFTLVFIPCFFCVCKKKKNTYLFILTVIELLMSVVMRTFNVTNLIFVSSIIAMLLFSENKSIHNLRSIIVTKNYRPIYVVFWLYTSIIVLLYINGIGVINKWGTISITGPYTLPHTIAYMYGLWFVIFLNQFIDSLPIIDYKCGLTLISGIVIILLTGVRSTLLAVIIYIFIRYTTLSTRKKIIGLVLFSVILFVLYRYTNVFSTVIEKTIFAETYSTISNGRIQIWLSSLNAVQNSNILEIVFGHGREYLLLFNQRNIGIGIQAHNDFITVFVSYGLLGLGLYIYVLFAFIRKMNRPVTLAVFFLILAFTNGLFEYTSFIYASLLLATIKDKKIQRRNSIQNAG